MKTLIVAICLLFIGCTTPCPSERAFFDSHEQLVYIEKGWFDKKEGRWLTQKEVDVIIEKYRKEFKNKFGCNQ